MKKSDLKNLAECVPTKTAARILGFSEATLRKMRFHGNGPKFIKAGPKKNSKVLYAIKDLEEFNKQNCQTLSSTAEWRKT